VAKILRAAGFFTGFVALPAAAAAAVYRLAEGYFRAHDLPVPFEWCGITAGAGAACGAIALSSLVLAVTQLIRRRLP